jgi:hypothetical protein
MSSTQNNLVIEAGSQYIINNNTIIANNLGVSSIEIRVPGIYRLECNGNKLTKLPDNIDEIENIMCDNNEITELPDIRNMDLNILSCSNNKITLLPIYSTILEQLYVSNNPLKNLLTVLAFGVNYGKLYNKMIEYGEIDENEFIFNELSLLAISIDQVMLLVRETNNEIIIHSYFDKFMKKSPDTQIHIEDTVKDLNDMNRVKKYNQVLNILLKKYNTNPNKTKFNRRIVIDAPNFKSRVESLKGLWESSKNPDIPAKLAEEPKTKESPPSIPKDIGKNIETLLGGIKSRKYKKKSRKLRKQSKRTVTNKKGTKRYRKRL